MYEGWNVYKVYTFMAPNYAVKKEKEVALSVGCLYIKLSFYLKSFSW